MTIHFNDYKNLTGQKTVNQKITIFFSLYLLPTAMQSQMTTVCNGKLALDWLANIWLSLMKDTFFCLYLLPTANQSQRTTKYNEKLVLYWLANICMTVNVSLLYSVWFCLVRQLAIYGLVKGNDLYKTLLVKLTFRPRL